MKNKVPKESVFKKKGFYAALYSCLGVVMVFGAVMSFNNLTAHNKKPPSSEASEDVDFSEMEATSQNQYGSYLDQAKTDKTKKDEAQQKSSEAKPEDTIKKQEKPAEPSDTKSSAPSVTKPTQAPAPVPEQKKDAETKKPVTKADSTTEEAVSEPVFQAFTEDSKMIWPVLGSVVMDFSAEHAIYDKTLDQYRTNDNICIAADVGTQVCSSAPGVVSKISFSKENGNTIVIDNGNGWTTTYSQLQDNILVSEGDVVKEGQIIGGVANPSIYSVLLGNHVEFKVMKDDQLVNPISLLE